MFNLSQYKLSQLGLTESQIKRVLERLPEHKIDMFIKSWKDEKLKKDALNDQTNYLNSQNPNNSYKNPDVDRGMYETRRSDLNYGNAHTRQQDLLNNPMHTSVPYMPRLVPNISDNRNASEEINSQYQAKSQSRHNPSANLDIMSYQLFGEPPSGNGYTIDYLNKKYRDLSRTLHPDKQNGDPSRFHMLMTCYEHLKSKSLNNSETQSRSEIKKERIVVPPPESLFDSKFDRNVFNKYYEKNSYQKEKYGHGDWLKSGSEVQQPERPSESNFNSAYENQKRILSQTVDSNRLSIIRTPEVPQEIQSRTTNYEILGNEDNEITDYSGETENGIQYTDIRVALETPHLLYEDTYVEEKDVSKSFANATTNFHNIPGELSNSEKDREANYLKKKREDEEYRRYRVRQTDEDIEEHFKNTHHNRIGA
tara:strand:+ start:1319 stop:2587 length:1269 start_codon:yes stop_codon:yes gene_type:complete